MSNWGHVEYEMLSSSLAEGTKIDQDKINFMKFKRLDFQQQHQTRIARFPINILCNRVFKQELHILYSFLKASRCI